MISQHVNMVGKFSFSKGKAKHLLLVVIATLCINYTQATTEVNSSDASINKQEEVAQHFFGGERRLSKFK